MNRLILLGLLILFSMSVASAACCVSSDSCIDIPDDRPELCVDGTLESEDCESVLTCTDTTGCCESASGDTCDPDASMYQCGLDGGTFHGDVDSCESYCSDTPPISDACEDLEANFEFSASHVQGSAQVLLTWTMCEDANAVIDRRTQADTDWLRRYDGDGSEHLDSADWDTEYQYRITITGAGSFEERIEFMTGNIECEGVVTTDAWCEGDTRARCSATNQYSEETCTEGCDDTGETAVCLGVAGACEITQTYLNVASQAACSDPNLVSGTCYYDRSETGIAGCYNCNDASSCYSFKTATACSNAAAACPNFADGCTWNDAGGAFGEGVCAPSDGGICRYYSSPADDERYSAILAPITYDESQDWFSNAGLACTEAGTTCSSAIDEATCDAVSTGQDYACGWTGDECVKSDYENPYHGDEPGPLCGTSSTCENDVSVPRLSGASTVDYDADTVTYTFTVEDEVSGTHVTIPEPSEYTIAYCATNADDTKCEDDWDYQTVSAGDPLTIDFSEHGISDELAEAELYASVRDPGYNTGEMITVRTNIDPSSPNPVLELEGVPLDDGHDPNTILATASWTGPGAGLVSIDGGGGTQVDSGVQVKLTGSYGFGTHTGVLTVTRPDGQTFSTTKTIMLEEPTFYITIDQPENGGIEPPGDFNIVVTTSQPADGCRYALTNLNDPPSSYSDMGSDNALQETGTSWTRSETRAASGYLHVRCVDGDKDVLATQRLEYVTEAPRITGIQANPAKIVFASAPNEYRSTIEVSTSHETKCTYTYDGESSTSDDYNETHYLPITFSTIGTHEVPVVCEDRLEQQTDEHIVEIIVDPSELFFAVPKPSGTIRTIGNVPYHITTASTGLYAVCEIAEIGVNEEGTNIEGTFDITGFEWYEGEGDYDLTVTCQGYENADKSGSARVDTQLAEFTIDATAPSGSASINGYTDTRTLDTIPSSASARFTYEDFSRIQAIRYEIREIDEGVLQSGTLSENLGTSGDASVAFNFNLEDDSEYFVVAEIEDVAGNVRNLESSRVIIRVPNACETSEMCGAECVDAGGGLCDVGDPCTDDTDCSSGTECTEDGICYYDHCTDGEPHENEEEIDCGGVCGACFISLLEPTFGVSADRTTDVVIGTSEPAECSWSDSSFTDVAITDRSEGGTVHTINGFTIGEGRTISVHCWNDELDGEKIFSLTWDDRDPVIEQFYANPNPVSWLTAPSNEYRTEFTVASNVEVLCRIAESDSSYDQMSEYLGNDYTTDLTEDAYNRIQQEWYGFSQPGSYTRYVDCIAKNGRTTGTSMTTFTADPSANPELEIRTPESGRTYSASSIEAKVDSQSTETITCFGELEDYGERELTPDPTDGNVYVRDVNLGSDGTNLDYRAMCTYRLGAGETDDTDSVSFSVDTTGPEFIDITISDPYGDESGVTNTPNAIETRIEAEDAISSVARYDYRVVVGSEEQASGTHPVVGSTTFTHIINGLDLSDGERVRLQAVAIDSRGNEASGESNELTYSYVEPPDTCSNGVLDEGEAAIDCGGVCGPCDGPAPYCGDGTPDYALGEQCDNGNENEDSCIADAGDTCTVCTTSCEWYFGYTPPPTEPPVGVCGDGLIQTPNSAGLTEQCDDGTQNTDATCTPDAGGSCTYCTTSCQLREVVDTSNPVPEPTYCGDGFQQKPNDENVYEECDDGTQNTASCTPGESGYCNYCSLSCTFEVEIDDTAPPAPTYCGDGTVQTPNSVGFSEDCDRGASNTDDACTPDAGGSCTICTSACVEITYTDDTTSPPEPTYCGDGFLEQPNDNGITEACDWGTENTNEACTPGEGETCEICTTSCEIETYSNDPSYTPVCGNGKLETDEQCDYGSENKNTCTADPGESCSVCTTSCEIFTHSTPGAGPACTTNAGCDGGFYCDDGTCREIEDVCTNGEYDSDYETDVDCGGTCDACEEGDACTGDLDCEEYYYCSDDLECTPDFDAMCSNGVEDEDYEAGVDCGDVCSSLFDKVCAPGESCSTDADCSTGYACTAGSCVVDETGPQPSSWCSADEFNNTLEDGTYCGYTCDELCTEGVGCNKSDDCVGGLVCTDGICVEAKKNDSQTQSCIPTNPVPPCGGDCEACTNGLDCIVDSDCQSNNCESGICRAGTDTTPPPVTGPDGETGDERSGGAWKWIIFFLLLVLLGVAGYVAYKYYYLPSKKPDYQEDQGMNAETMNAGFDDTGSADGSVTPPSGPPIMTEKQQHVNELIRQKRSEEKEQKRSEFFSTFDESKLDSEPEKIDEAAVPKTKLEASPDDEKPIVATRKKSHDSFKKILDDAKDDLDE